MSISKCLASLRLFIHLCAITGYCFIGSTITLMQWNSSYDCMCYLIGKVIGEERPRWTCSPRWQCWWRGERVYNCSSRVMRKLNHLFAIGIEHLCGKKNKNKKKGCVTRCFWVYTAELLHVNPVLLFHIYN